MLLQRLKLSVVENSYAGTMRLIIRRIHIWADSLHYFKNNIDLERPIKITFIGEADIDEGSSCTCIT